VSNGVKHGQAQHVRIGLSSNAKTLTLTIKDDGSASARSIPAAGMGLRIMHYRAGMIGASLTIEKQQSGGTCVTCKLSWHKPCQHIAKGVMVFCGTCASSTTMSTPSNRAD